MGVFQLVYHPAMDTLLQDVRYGTRQLFRQRGSSLVAIVTLALGIGVSTAIFSVIDATRLIPRGHRDAGPWHRRLAEAAPPPVLEPVG